MATHFHRLDRPKRILVKNDESITYDEALAGGTITPGMLITKNSSGKFIAHNSAGGACLPQFAIEDSLQGRTIGDDYVADELVRAVTAKPGDHVLAHIADGENIAIGDMLSSNGDGTLQKLAGTERPVARANEAVDASVSTESFDQRRIVVEIV